MISNDKRWFQIFVIIVSVCLIGCYIVWVFYPNFNFNSVFLRPINLILDKTYKGPLSIDTPIKIIQDKLIDQEIIKKQKVRIEDQSNQLEKQELLIQRLLKLLDDNNIEYKGIIELNLKE